jgi:hypothetical protein
VIPFLLFGSIFLFAQEGLSSDPDIRKAQIAVYREMRTRPGKDYDSTIGKEFQQKYVAVVRDCRKQANADQSSFTMYVQFTKDGHVEAVLLDPAAPVDECIRKILLKDAFSPPPQPDFWVQITLQFRK